MTNPTPDTEPTLADLILPMPGKIAVRVDPKEEVTKSGLYLTAARSMMETRATSGTVIAVAEDPDSEDADPDSDLDPPHRRVAVGDAVIFGKYAGTRVSYKREEAIILSEREVLAIFLDPEQVSKLRIKA